MNQPRPLVDPSVAVRLLRGQFVAMLVLAVAGLLVSPGAALSIAIGAGIAVVGSAYFALQAFRHAGATSAKHIVHSFYKGEAGKFVLTATLFAVVFVTVRSVQGGWLLTGFILEQLVAWAVLLRPARPKQ